MMTFITNRCRGFIPGVETLDARCVPAVMQDDAHLDIVGTSGKDVIVVVHGASAFSPEQVRVQINGGPFEVFAGVTSVAVRTKNGQDRVEVLERGGFLLEDSLACTVNLGAGNDQFTAALDSRLSFGRQVGLTVKGGPAATAWRRAPTWTLCSGATWRWRSRAAAMRTP